MATWHRYLLFQLPGWIITGLILLGLLNWQYLSGWLAVGVFGGWIGKDLLLFPFLRRAYERDIKPGSQGLIGFRGVAQEHLTPRGYVRVRGELWNAIATPVDQVISAGTEVEIVNANGMQVMVTATRRNREN
jgi:membrane protein implicated in regulation of membrane protease activity